MTEQIIKWYNKNKRDLPWRDNKDPYIIWVSEIILQQTQIKTGIPYFKKFICFSSLLFNQDSIKRFESDFAKS